MSQMKMTAAELESERREGNVDADFKRKPPKQGKEKPKKEPRKVKNERNKARPR